MPHVVVFDTNILFSGLGWQGAPYRCLELARSGAVEGLTSREILDELVEKLQDKLLFSAEQITDTVADLLGFLRLVTIPNTLRVIADDADDDKIIECAVVGGARYIVTGDRHLLMQASYAGVDIIRAADFLAVMSQADG